MDAARMLANIPLFDDLSEEDIMALASHMNRKEYKANDVIFKKGDSGDSMYLVGDGIVSIHLPGEGNSRVLLKEVHVGHYFGELALFDTKPRSALAVATTDCELLEL